MKKIFLGLSAIAAMLFASCAQDELVSNEAGSGDEIVATFELTTPQGIQTRAIGDGTSADVVACAVYDAAGNELEALRNNELTVSGKKATYSIRLVKGQSYRVAFFAYNKAAAAYDVTDMKNIKVKDMQLSNIEARDAFTAYIDVTASETMNAVKKEVRLYRPFAQLNLGSVAEDIEAAEAAGIVVKKSKITVENMYTAFSAYQDEVVGGTSTQVFDMNVIPTEDLTANGKTYDYLALNYILVGDTLDPKALTTVTFEWEAENGTKNVPVTEFNNVPVQRNYRTNILGYLLTNPADFNIVIDEEFKKPDYNEPWVGDVQAPAYDAVTKTFTVSTAAQLAWISAASNGKVRTAVTRATEEGFESFSGYTVKLDADIDLCGQPWMPIGHEGNVYQNGFKGTFDGNGHTISNLTVTNSRSAGLFAHTCTATIKNLTIKNVNLNSNHYAGAILAWGEQGGTDIVIENCHVDGGTITLTPDMKSAGLYDNGDKAGGITGFMYGGQISGCSVKNVTITAYRDLGGISGHGDKTKVNGCEVDGVKLVVDQSVEPYDGAPKAANANAIVGRNNNGTCELTDNVEGTVEIAGTKVVASQEELAAAITEAGAVVKLVAGEYTFPKNIADGVTIECADGTVFTGSSNLNVPGVTVKNAEFANPTGNVISSSTLAGSYVGCKFTGYNVFRYGYLNRNSDEELYFENCVFDADDWCFHFDDGYSKKIVAVNCQFKGRVALAGTVANASFTNCSFEDKYVNTYGPAQFTNCEFKNTRLTPLGNHVDYNGCKYNGSDVTYKNLSFYDGYDCTVSIDGEKYTKVYDAEQLTTAINNLSNINVILNEGTYQGSFTVKKNISLLSNNNATIDGIIGVENRAHLTLKDLTMTNAYSGTLSGYLAKTNGCCLGTYVGSITVDGCTFDIANENGAIYHYADGEGITLNIKNSVFNCNGKRPIKARCNTTITGCTFNDQYRYAVQIYANPNIGTEKVVFKNNIINNPCETSGKAFAAGVSISKGYECSDVAFEISGNTLNSSLFSDLKFVYDISDNVKITTCTLNGTQITESRIYNVDAETNEVK